LRVGHGRPGLGGGLGNVGIAEPDSLAHVAVVEAEHDDALSTAGEEVDSFKYGHDLFRSAAVEVVNDDQQTSISEGLTNVAERGGETVSKSEVFSESGESEPAGSGG